MSRPKRPDVELEIEVTDDDVAFFRENGYFVVDRITTDEELDWITEIYDELYALPYRSA